MSRATATPATTAACPHCKKPLVDPNGLGWCKACGYCRSLAESDAKIAPQQTASEPDVLLMTGDTLRGTPFWFWVTLLGVIVIAGGTVAAVYQLHLTPFQRALFCTLEIAAGVLMMFTGQFLGLMRVAPEDPSLGLKDAFFPFRLYGLVFAALPATRLTIFLGAWGLTAIITASIAVGGLDHWFTYLPNKSRPYVVDKIPKG